MPYLEDLSLPLARMCNTSMFIFPGTYHKRYTSTYRYILITSSLLFLAWAGSMAASLACLLSPISCSLSERFGCRIVAICGSLICMVSLLSSSFVTKLELLYFTHGILFGLGNNFVYTPPFLVISERFTKWRSFALCLANAGTATGMLIYGPCLQLMLDYFGWRHTLRVISSISIFGIVFASSYSSKLVQKSSVKEEHAISKRNGQGESDKVMKDKNKRESMLDKENQNGCNHVGKISLQSL